MAETKKQQKTYINTIFIYFSSLLYIMSFYKIEKNTDVINKEKT